MDEKIRSLQNTPVNNMAGTIPTIWYRYSNVDEEYVVSAKSRTPKFTNTTQSTIPTSPRFSRLFKMPAT